MTDTTAIAAVVVSYNGERWIAACLKSLLSGSCRPLVIVVDNFSADGTVAIIERDFPEVILIRNRTNAGFGAANNIGIREALSRGCTSVLLLNQDATIDADAIRLLDRIAAAQPDAGVIAPLHLSYDGTMIDRHVIGYLSGDAPSLFDDIRNSAEKEVYEMSFFPAAGWLISSRALEAIGGFDPLFFMYGEDKDYCARVRHAGMRILLAPKATICHYHGGPPEREAPTAKRIETECYWELILWLKDSRMPFLKNVLCALREHAVRTIRDAVYLDAASAFARTRALVRVVLQLRRIAEHRQRSLGATRRLFLS